MKFFLKTVLIFFAIVAAQHSVSQNNIIDEIVWVVGDEAILKSEVEEVRRDMLLRETRMDNDPYCFIPEQLAVNKLMLDQAKIDSIEVSEANVNRTLEYYISESIARAGSVEKLEEYYSKSIGDIREDLRKQIREQNLIEGVKRKHFGEIMLTPSEIRKYYAKIPQDSLPFVPTTMEVQIVTVDPHIPLKEIDEVKAKLRAYRDRINSGETQFQTLAVLYSEDKASATKGGELGFMGRAQLLPEFANVAFTLNDPKKVSNIVETEYGYHIIQLIERRGDRANFRHILLKPKVPQEEIDKAEQRLDSIQQQISAGKFTFEEAATFISSDKDTRNNKGIMVNQNPESRYAGTPRFQMNELNQDVANAVGNLKVGAISKPFIMRTASGKKVAAIAKVTDRIEGHKASLNTDYQEMKSLAENAKREELMDEWLQEKIRNTYVRIDDNWKGCDFKYKGWIK